MAKNGVLVEKTHYDRLDLLDMASQHGLMAVIFREAKAGSKTRRFIAMILPPEVKTQKEAEILRILCLKNPNKRDNALYNALGKRIVQIARTGCA